jgi:hypothetical protein
MHKIFSWRHSWITVVLLALNGWAWLGAAPVTALPEVSPRLAPEIGELREKLWSGKHTGEAFASTFTDQSASEAVAWFLAKRPEIPFSHPQVQFTPDGIRGRGIVHLLGLRTEVYGVVGVVLHNGLPVITIRELGVAGAKAPAFVVETITTELNKQADAVNRMPMIITRLELQNGALVLEGNFK